MKNNMYRFSTAVEICSYEAKINLSQFAAFMLTESLFYYLCYVDVYILCHELYNIPSNATDIMIQNFKNFK